MSDLERWMRARGIDPGDVISARADGATVTLTMPYHGEAGEPISVRDSDGDEYRRTGPGRYQRVKSNGRLGLMTFTLADLDSYAPLTLRYADGSERRA